MSTIFPEIRLKKFIEMRGADGGPWKIICALSALWVGLLYDSQSQEAALDLIKGWNRQDHDYLRAEVGFVSHLSVNRPKVKLCLLLSWAYLSYIATDMYSSLVNMAETVHLHHHLPKHRGSA